jgi:hypothetical protein
MMLPARVLPSNAPALGDDGLHLTNRVLQEHSGNRQHNTYSYTDYEQKIPTSFSVENAYAHRPQPPIQHQPARRLYHPQPVHRQEWKYGYSSNGYAEYSPEEEVKNQVEAKYLYRRFRQSDPYVKYRNRQQKEDKGNDDNKWPDHLEKAFFRGMFAVNARYISKLTLSPSIGDLEANGPSQDPAQAQAAWSQRANCRLYLRVDW